MSLETRQHHQNHHNLLGHNNQDVVVQKIPSESILWSTSSLGWLIQNFVSSKVLVIHFLGILHLQQKYMERFLNFLFLYVQVLVGAHVQIETRIRIIIDVHTIHFIVMLSLMHFTGPSYINIIFIICILRILDILNILGH